MYFMLENCIDDLRTAWLKEGLWGVDQLFGISSQPQLFQLFSPPPFWLHLSTVWYLHCNSKDVAVKTPTLTLPPINLYLMDQPQKPSPQNRWVPSSWMDMESMDQDGVAGWSNLPSFRDVLFKPWWSRGIRPPRILGDGCVKPIRDVHQKHWKTRWWQLKCFFGIFTPKIGEDEPILKVIYSKGLKPPTR